MSLGVAEAVARAPGRGSGSLPRLGVALAALALVGAALALIAWLTVPVAAPLPARTPFGLAREAAPAATGLGGAILALQASFYRSLQGALAALKGGAGPWALVALGFAYGVFHAAGPGHGKAVISAYLLASGRALRRGLGLSLAAALLQAVVAIALVTIAALLLKATAATMTRTVSLVETASFAAVAALGAVLTWRKAGRFLSAFRTARGGGGAAASASACAAGECGHEHMPRPEEAGAASWRELAGIVLAAGLRPCAGAIVVLVFALSQGLFAAGVAATFAMALGTALTTGTIAALAVLAKGAALRLAGGRGQGGAVALAGLELLAAAFVGVLGASLLIGLAGSPAAS